jgi:hypothetical protein
MLALHQLQAALVPINTKLLRSKSFWSSPDGSPG